MRVALITLLIPGFLAAQLITNTQAIPKTANPPVVFINGYQQTCAGADFAGTFGAADQVLQAAGIVSVFFNNCSVGGVGAQRPSMEAEGAAFGQFLAGLKYTDGSAVGQVDVIVHSMGGLIFRSYLAGKKEGSPATFAPPLTVPVRKAIFIATPHFGTAIANLLGALAGNDIQTQQLALGSQFLTDLNSWNQGSDDLRGIDAISIAGNGGTGNESGVQGFDDGVVALTSSSLGFYRPGVTRIVPYCHTATTLLAIAGYCGASTPVVNGITTAANNPVSTIIISFLTGTDIWKSTGTAAEAQANLTVRSGVILQLRDKSDAPIAISGATVTSVTPNAGISANSASGSGYSETLAAAEKAVISVAPVSGASQNGTVLLKAGTSSVAVVKPGPTINPGGVFPAGRPLPAAYDVAPGAHVTIYGSNLAGETRALSPEYPTQVGDLQVLVGDTPAQLVFVSAGQINFLYPNVAPGLTKLTVRNANGQHTVNIRVAAATPTIFLLDAAEGTAAALNALTAQIVGTAAPLRAGDFLSLYLTGLGATARRDGLDYAVEVPVIRINGQVVPVSFAGRNPTYTGLDQINCQIPAGIAGDKVAVTVTSGGRTSNTAYIAIR